MKMRTAPAARMRKVLSFSSISSSSGLVDPFQSSHSSPSLLSFAAGLGIGLFLSHAHPLEERPGT